MLIQKNIECLSHASENPTVDSLTGSIFLAAGHVSFDRDGSARRYLSARRRRGQEEQSGRDACSAQGSSPFALGEARVGWPFPATSRGAAFLMTLPPCLVP